MKNKFKLLSKEERANTYGGFAWMVFLPILISLVQTLVTAGIGIYQAASNKTGSVSMGGVGKITNESNSSVELQGSKIQSLSPPKFYAY